MINRQYPVHRRRLAHRSGLVLGMFACRDDETAFGRNGGLSYVINAGYRNLRHGRHRREPSWARAMDDEIRINWDCIGATRAHQAPDRIASHNSGLAWRDEKDEHNVRDAADVDNSHRLSDILDGTSQTILFSENVNAGADGWSGPDIRNCAFVYPVNPRPRWRDISDSANRNLYYQVLPLDTYEPGRLNTDRYINGALSGVDGKRPFPNSQHPGGVVVTFCDGAVQFVSEDIENAVFAELMSPRGTRNVFGLDVVQLPADDNY